MRKFQLFCLGILATMPRVQNAAAASITNLDSVPYDLHVKVGEQVQPVHIAPGATWSTQAYDVYVRYQNNWMELNFDSNYAIWKGGSLVEQSQGPKMHGRGM